MINSTNKNKLKKWIDNLEKKNKNVLLVYGKSGLGKYTAVKEALENEYYDVHTFHSIDFMNKKDIKIQIKKMVNNKSIYMMLNKKKTKNAIIIKEMEALNKPHNIKFIADIINTNFKNTNIPLICIASGDFFKKFGDLEKIADKINFKKTNNKLFKKFMQTHFRKNDLSVDGKLITYMCNKLESNFRKFNSILDYMINNRLDKFTLDNFKEIIQMVSSNENNEIELYEMISRILNDPDLDMNTVLDFFNVEKIFLPLMLYQNLKSKLFYRNPNKLEEYNKVMDVVSKSDIIHKYIFDYHYWELQKPYCILSCYYPYHIIKKSEKRIKLEDIKFTSILNKNSFKYATYLNCNKIMRNCKRLFNFDSMLLIYYCKFLSFYLLSENIINQERGIDLLIENNFQISDVSKIIKFSNLEVCDKTYNKKIYNKLKKIYKNKIANK